MLPALSGFSVASESFNVAREFFSVPGVVRLKSVS